MISVADLPIEVRELLHPCVRKVFLGSQTCARLQYVAASESRHFQNSSDTGLKRKRRSCNRTMAQTGMRSLSHSILAALNSAILGPPRRPPRSFACGSFRRHAYAGV